MIGNGVASMIDDLDECRKGLRLLMGQQAGMPDIEFTDQQVRSVTVWKIEVRHLTAKIHPSLSHGTRGVKLPVSDTAKLPPWLLPVGCSRGVTV